MNRNLVFITLLAATNASAALPLTQFHGLQRRFSTPAVERAGQTDIVSKIREIEGRVSWLAIDAGYAKQDAEWSYQLLVQYLNGRNPDPYALWRAERLALSAAEQAKTVAEKIRKETTEIDLLLNEAKPDSAGAQEAEYLLGSAKEAAANASATRDASSNLYALSIRFREAVGQRLIWAAEILERESVDLSAEAKALENSSHRLHRRLSN